jgi:DNA/RNA endonuclease YhcR with UshA esterase domain
VASIALCAVRPGEGAPATISPQEASQHVGESTSVRGTVIEVGHSRSGTVFLDFGAPYPQATFTAVIFSDNAAQFPEASQLAGKAVSVSGTIQLYRGRPEIIVSSPKQLGH